MRSAARMRPRDSEMSHKERATGERGGREWGGRVGRQGGAGERVSAASSQRVSLSNDISQTISSLISLREASFECVCARAGEIVSAASAQGVAVSRPQPLPPTPGVPSSDASEAILIGSEAIPAVAAQWVASEAWRRASPCPLQVPSSRVSTGVCILYRPPLVPPPRLKTPS